MVAPSEGSVALVRFPFSDLSSSKLRPAVVLAFTGRDDWILCQVTSNPYSDPAAIRISVGSPDNKKVFLCVSSEAGGKTHFLVFELYL